MAFSAPVGSGFLCTHLWWSFLRPLMRETRERFLGMTTIRRFCCIDLLRFSTFHFDPHVGDSRSLRFRAKFLASWPNSCHFALAPCNQIMGYIFGKVEGKEEQKHAQIASISCDTKYGKLALNRRLVARLEEVNDKIDKAFYIESLLRTSSKAVQVYHKLGYVSFKRKSNPGEGDWIYLRKPLSRLLVALRLYLLSQRPTDDREIMLHCVD